MRRQKVREWRKKQTPAYMKWLHARRKLRLDKGVRYEQVLRDLARGASYEETRQTAIEELEWAWEKEREIGNRYDHEKDLAYWSEAQWQREQDRLA